jgi:hypothetical protein
MDLDKTAAQIAIDELVDKHTDIDIRDFMIITKLVKIAQATGKTGAEKKAMVIRAVETFGLAVAGAALHLAIELGKRWVMEELSKVAQGA